MQLSIFIQLNWYCIVGIAIDCIIAIRFDRLTRLLVLKYAVFVISIFNNG